jgi:hypothetical protein
MSETEAKKIPRTVSDKKLLTGVWRLTYKLTNRMGPEGFSGRLLTSYTDTMTFVPRHLYNEYGIMQPGYFIERQATIFTPDTNPMHRNIVDWLIGHPDVGIEEKQVKMSKAFVEKKKSNPRIKLINLDYEEIEELVDEDFVDKLVGRLSQDIGKTAIPLETMRFILAKLNLPYFEQKFLKNKTIEKQKLRKRLKNYVRSGEGTLRAEEVNSILDNLASAKFEYEIKEMQRLEILYIANGMYKYESNPLGSSLESVIQYFTNNPDFYTELTELLYKKVKAEINQ